MSLISEENHNKVLSKYNINIKTIYRDIDKMVETNSDKSKNDVLTKAMKTEKNYFIADKKVKKLFGLDSRIEYSNINNQVKKNTYECPNCRMTSYVEGVLDACPFCGVHTNIDYVNKDISNKATYELSKANKNCVIYTTIASIIIALIIGIIFYINTGKLYAIKSLYIGGAAFITVFIVLYLIVALIFLLPKKLKKDKIIKNDDSVWEGLDKKKISYTTFYNNLQYELDKYYYVDNKISIIDYDIIDYYNFKLVEDASSLYLSMDLIIREIYLDKGKIKPVTKVLKATFKRNNKPIVIDDDGKIHKINCHNCGASIDITANNCGYCDTPNNYNQEWYLLKIK